MFGKTQKSFTTFGKKQKGFTLVELMLSLWFIGVILFLLFLASCVVYAAGKYLFGWWG